MTAETRIDKSILYRQVNNHTRRFCGIDQAKACPAFWLAKMYSVCTSVGLLAVHYCKCG